MKNIVTDIHTTNQTLLTPFLQRYIYNWLLDLIPKALPANYITLTSLVAIGTGFILSHQSLHQNTWLSLLIASLLFLYLLCDDLDGLQARRTHTQSSLGEFLDHYSDSLCLGASSFILLNAIPPSIPYVLLAHLIGVYLLITTTFYSQYQTKHLQLHEISAPEALFLYTLLILLSSNDAIFGFLHTKLVGIFTPTDLFISLLTVVYVYYAFKNILSCPQGLSGKFYSYLLGGIVTTVLAFQASVPLVGNALIVLYHGVYIGHLITSKVTEKKEPFPILIIPIYLFVQYVSGSKWMLEALPILLGIQLTVYLYTFVRVFQQFRHEWKWYNRMV